MRVRCLNKAVPALACTARSLMYNRPVAEHAVASVHAQYLSPARSAGLFHPVRLNRAVVHPALYMQFFLRSPSGLPNH
jgi:hypothetical protein